nr:hypothetical protein Iba_chr13dCG3400 [Ipomoea batatas]
MQYLLVRERVEVRKRNLSNFQYPLLEIFGFHLSGGISATKEVLGKAKNSPYCPFYPCGEKVLSLRSLDVLYLERVVSGRWRWARVSVEEVGMLKERDGFGWPINVKRKSEVTDPISRISSDNIHMHPDERKNLPGLGTRILDDKVAPVGLIGDMVDNEWTAAGGGAEREEGIKNVLYHSVLLRDQLRWVVLHVLGLPNQLSQ